MISLAGIMLSEINQSQEATCCMIPLKFIETNSGRMVAWGWVWEGMGNCGLIGAEFQFGEMKEFCGSIVVMVAQHDGCTYCH